MKRDQIKEGQEQIDQNKGLEHLVKTGSGIAGVARENKDQQKGPHHCQKQVGERARKGDPKHICSRVFQVSRVYGNRLGPPEKGHGKKDRHQRQNVSSQNVGVGGGIEGQPALAFGCIVAKMFGHHAVSELVKTQGKQKRYKIDSNAVAHFEQIQITHGTTLAQFGRRGNEISRLLEG